MGTLQSTRFIMCHLISELFQLIHQLFCSHIWLPLPHLQPRYSGGLSQSNLISINLEGIHSLQFPVETTAEYLILYKYTRLYFFFTSILKLRYSQSIQVCLIWQSFPQSSVSQQLLSVHCPSKKFKVSKALCKFQILRVIIFPILCGLSFYYFTSLGRLYYF